MDGPVGRSGRPYKTSFNVEKALDILINEAKSGKVDSLLVDVFVKGQPYPLFNLL